MALIDHFMPVLGFASLMRSDPGLADTAYETVRRDLDALLEQAEKAARQALPLPQREAAMSDALFAVCAFVDESLLTSAWSHRLRWAGSTLQSERFHTVNAGEEFFARLDALYALVQGDNGPVAWPEAAPAPHSAGTIPPSVSTPPVLSVTTAMPALSEALAREVLEIYASCLTLGYTGRYYHAEEQPTLDRLASAARDQVLEGRDLAPGQVFPEVYRQTPDKKPPFLGFATRLLLLWGTPALAALAILGMYTLILDDRLRVVENMLR